MKQDNTDFVLWVNYFLSCLQVSKAGTVKVENLMQVERYSHVMHMSSTVCCSYMITMESIYFDCSTVQCLYLSCYMAPCLY